MAFTTPIAFLWHNLIGAVVVVVVGLGDQSRLVAAHNCADPVHRDGACSVTGPRFGTPCDARDRHCRSLRRTSRLPAPGGTLVALAGMVPAARTNLSRDAFRAMLDRASTFRVAGYSLIEMPSCSPSGVLPAWRPCRSLTARPSIRGDGAMRVILGQMRTARELAITSAATCALFSAPDQFRSCARSARATPPRSSGRALEGGAIFTLVSGRARHARRVRHGAPRSASARPRTSSSRPTARWSTRTATCQRQRVPGDSGSTRGARAITVLGSTGRIRAYRGTAGTGCWHEDAQDSSKGFSLIEVMFALGILTVGVLGLSRRDGGRHAEPEQLRRAT